MKPSALTTRTMFVEHDGRRLAYRSLGNGPPIVFCNRFRGTLDTWDPAFIDALAEHHQVIWFSYSGMGRSGGPPASDILEFARDARTVVLGLGLQKVVIGGWSIGGLVAQTVVTNFPELVSHAVLLATSPPGEKEYPPQNLFFERALKPVNDLADEEILFFEPKSEASRKAAGQSHERIAARLEDHDVPMTPAKWDLMLKASATFSADKDNSLAKLMSTNIPLLVICGDHDIACPVENWYALTRELPTMHLVVSSRTGHGPQHEFPEWIATYIVTFLRANR